MALGTIFVFLLFSSVTLAHPNDGSSYVKRTTTPDNTCGGQNRYTCNPNDPLGGSCCSASGYCGYTAPYCGPGCQSAYGSCFGTSPPATQSGSLWVVKGVGSFTTTKTFTFSGTTLPSGLLKSDYSVEDPAPAPYSHKFVPADVTVGGGYLQLKVPGGQTTSPLNSAEVTTNFGYGIKYASVRTTAILGASAGACNGNFFYHSDSQEMDIEYLSDATSDSNPGDGTKPMHYTNQAVDGNPDDKTYDTAPSPSDATTAAHEYRIDWINGKTLYYLDAVLQKTFTNNVPTVAGNWVWNNWANGDPGWTGDPPTTDNIFKISKIVMYFNTSAV